MARYTFLLVLIVVFSLLGCSKEDDEPVNSLEEHPSYISRVDTPESAIVGSTVPITIYFTVNNGCGQFGSFKVEKKNDATYIEVYPKYREGFCTMDLPTRQVIYEFKPEAPGTYTFKFLPVYPDQVITKTIEVVSR
ncbi:hypothetical protein ACFSRY_07085 [Pontibacter locisalis]|uniref:GOLD domain-containing protein n=1 Tax=Pontibacter locisalis TaxID=1719035 RepID=A0ABW5IKU2_9BACT